jgi:hypothetical protein
VSADPEVTREITRVHQWHAKEGIYVPMPEGMSGEDANAALAAVAKAQAANRAAAEAVAERLAATQALHALLLPPEARHA